MKRCTSFEGDFGPFIQYSHVRLCSVQRKNPNIPLPSSIDEIDLAIPRRAQDQRYHHTSLTVSCCGPDSVPILGTVHTRHLVFQAESSGRISMGECQSHRSSGRRSQGETLPVCPGEGGVGIGDEAVELDAFREDVAYA